jgi:TonB family protein
MRAWPLMPIIVTTLSLLPSASAAKAREEWPETGRLEGIEAISDVMTGASIYFPRIEMWPLPDIILNPSIVQTRAGAKSFFLRAMVRDLEREGIGVLTLSIDGTAVEFDLHLQGSLRTLTSGCTPRAEIAIEDEAEIVRRISRATTVKVEYRAGTFRRKYTLVPEDLKRFQRGVSLYDMADLPPATRFPKDLKDGTVYKAWTKDISNPELILSSNVSPRYPPQAIAMKKSAQIVLVAQILKDGTVGTVRPAHAYDDGCGFAEAAVDAVKQWKYTPARKNGQPVEIEFTVVVNFVLKN